MIHYFLKHQWAQFRRSASFERELGISIFIFVMSLFVLASIISVAYVLPKIVLNQPEITDPVAFFHTLLVYYFISELMMRYFLQKVPALDIQPYLGLPIRRKDVAIFLIGKSLISPFTVLSLLVTLPFATEVIQPKAGTLATVVWIASIFFISLAIHFFNIIFKKKLEDHPFTWIFLVVFAAGNYALATTTKIDLLKPFTLFLEATLSFPVLALIPFTLVSLLALSTFKFYRDNLYLEELSYKSNSPVETYSEKLNFLGRSSLTSTLILQEIRMILRHKRTRSVLMLSLFFVGYGLLFFGRETSNKGLTLFIGIFISGAFAINYGQFFWSWNTNQLDFYLTKPLSIITWLQARYNLLIASSIITTVLAIPYVFFGWDILIMILCCSLYNIGINIPLMMRLSIWKPKPIDLNKGAFMNYEGTGAAQWVMGLPMIAGPMLIFFIFNILVGYYAALAGVGLTGIIGFTLRDYLIRKIASKMQSIKYKLINNLTL
jgi:hypothetical protein